MQVATQMRPSCDKILDMPIIRKKIEKLFPDEYEDQDSNMALL